MRDEEIKEEIEKMIATPVKPIEPIKVNFESAEEMERFIEYAERQEKTESYEMDKIRAIFREHLKSQFRG